MGAAAVSGSVIYGGEGRVKQWVCLLCSTLTSEGVYLTGYWAGVKCGATACAVFICELCWQKPQNAHLRHFDVRLTEP